MTFQNRTCCLLFASLLFLIMATHSDATKRGKKGGLQHALKRIPAASPTGCRAGKEFQCRSGECIDIRYVCDSDDDCKDGSDEAQNCPTDCSGPNQFKCQDGVCITAVFECDAISDCADDSDELHCAKDCSGINQFKCADGTCEALYDRCDGIRDCPDGSDELNCPSKAPPF